MLNCRDQRLGQCPACIAACTITLAEKALHCAARSTCAEHEVALQTTLRIKGHDDDVNAVAFMDDSSNLIASGSDDTLIKVRESNCCAQLVPS